jgi:hypothetical protein
MLALRGGLEGKEVTVAVAETWLRTWLLVDAKHVLTLTKTSPILVLARRFVTTDIRGS